MPFYIRSIHPDDAWRIYDGENAFVGKKISSGARIEQSSLGNSFSFVSMASVDVGNGRVADCLHAELQWEDY